MSSETAGHDIGETAGHDTGETASHDIDGQVGGLIAVIRMGE
jgi:hypothetical protein